MCVCWDVYMYECVCMCCEQVSTVFDVDVYVLHGMKRDLCFAGNIHKMYKKGEYFLRAYLQRCSVHRIDLLGA